MNFDRTELAGDRLDGTTTDNGIVLKASSTPSTNSDAKENNSATHQALLEFEMGLTMGTNRSTT